VLLPTLTVTNSCAPILPFPESHQCLVKPKALIQAVTYGETSLDQAPDRALREIDRHGEAAVVDMERVLGGSQPPPHKNNLWAT